MNQIFLLFFNEFFFISTRKFLKIHQLNIIKIIKKDYKKKLVKGIKAFLKKKKKKSNNMVVMDMKMYQKMKNKSWLSIENTL